MLGMLIGMSLGLAMMWVGLRSVWRRRAVTFGWSEPLAEWRGRFSVARGVAAVLLGLVTVAAGLLICVGSLLSWLHQPQ